jgi:hypothetical protein
MLNHTTTPRFSTPGMLNLRSNCPVRWHLPFRRVDIPHNFQLRRIVV